MGWLLGVLGLALLVYALIDVLWTCFLEGGAPVTTRACSWVAKGLLKCQTRRTSRRLIAKAGLASTVVTVLVWGVSIWTGWTLIFCASRGALVATDTGRPADFTERVYFVGYTIFTLGLGDYKPVGHFYEIITALAAGSGFILFGLALAYLVPVVSAATAKRSLGVTVWTLGKDPGDIIARAWNGADSTALNPHLVSLVPMLAGLGESHLTYPVLHYFHSSKRSSSAAASVAALDEALTILECGLQQGCSLDVPSLGAAREAITEFLNTLAPALIFPAADSPPTPSLQPLRDLGVPAVEDDLFEASLSAVAERRRMLLALVRNEGWDWDAVWPKAEKEQERKPLFPPATAGV
jgi:Ion channel